MDFISIQQHQNANHAQTLIATVNNVALIWILLIINLFVQNAAMGLA